MEPCPACESQNTETRIVEDRQWIKCHDCKYDQKLAEQEQQQGQGLSKSVPIEKIVAQSEVGEMPRWEQQGEAQLNQVIREQEVHQEEYDPTSVEAQEAMQQMGNINYDAATSGGSGAGGPPGDDMGYSTTAGGGPAYDAELARICCTHPDVEKFHNHKKKTHDGYNVQ